MLFQLQIIFLLLTLAGLSGGQSAALPPKVLDFSGATYVGSAGCVTCHESYYAQWADSLHNKMIRRIDPSIVEGDFDNQKLEHEGWQFRMFMENGQYLVSEKTPSGNETILKADLALGSKRIQHYISRRPDGRLRLAIPTWDIRLKKWIHNSDVIRGLAHGPTGEHEVEVMQIWNQKCWNCHTSQEEEGFDIDSDTFQTTFTEPGINCEMCHGPASVHVRRMEKDRQAEIVAIANPKHSSPREAMTGCLQCHTRRIMLKKGYHVGEEFYDYFMPKFIELTSEPGIWPERHRRFGNEGLVLWESECYLKGNATCVNCHNPHRVTISEDRRYRNTDVLCLQCHQNFQEKEVVSEHTHHPLESEGSRCVNCHMLLLTAKTIQLLNKAEVRDHHISIPIPENTTKHHIPNTCNNACHEDQSVSWVVEWMDRWYPQRPKADPVVDTFAVARSGKPEAVPLLTGLLADSSQPLAVRSSAAKFLGEFKQEGIATQLIAALKDPEPMVRAEAARSLSENPTPLAVEPLKQCLDDKIRIVRLNAVFSLIRMGIIEVDGPDRDKFLAVKNEYFQFLQEFPTVFEIRVDLGTYHAIHGNYLVALQEYKNAIKIDPFKPLGHYYAGVTYAQLGLYDSALASLTRTLELEADFRNTRDLIAQVLEAMKEF